MVTGIAFFKYAKLLESFFRKLVDFKQISIVCFFKFDLIISKSGVAKTMVITTQFDHEFIPASSRKWSRHPKLMIVLHGRGDSLKPFRQLPEELELPEMNYLLLNAPRKFDGGYSWYALEPNHETGILRSRNRLHLLMEELQWQGWDSRDIFLFGLSQGCLMSCDLAMTYSQPFAGLIGCSGYVWFFPHWRRMVSPAAWTTPWIMTHGFNDKDIPISETRTQVKRLLRNGIAVEWLEMNKGHEVDVDIEAPMLGRWVRRQVAKSTPRNTRAAESSPLDLFY